MIYKKQLSGLQMNSFSYLLFQFFSPHHTVAQSVCAGIYFEVIFRNLSDVFLLEQQLTRVI